MILFLFLKAYQPDLFDEQVTVSGHATKKGTYVQPYQAKRKKRADKPNPLFIASNFLKSATISEPADELIREHERLVDVLRSPSHADDLKEADEQESELREYKKKSKRKKKMRKAFAIAPLRQLLKARANG